MIDHILMRTPLGEQVTGMILWGESGQVIYSSNPEVDASVPANEAQLLLELYSPKQKGRKH